MNGLSTKELEIIAYLEFDGKYFFTRDDVKHFFETKNQERHTFYKLLKKGRIEKLNKIKYYLVPIKAKSGKWAEWSFIIVDEVMNGEDYFIGGWAAANYWKLTDQVPMKTEVYSTKRQGKKKFLTTSIIFRRTSSKRLNKAVTKKIDNHTFKILSKEESKKWLSQRNY
ncbi:hypothetical protein K9M74_04865 [Candidatus Woesearchaeota archaeon]|nr:hypothetical protein [Candidatus Woesearchaeota archaeon]